MDEYKIHVIKREVLVRFHLVKDDARVEYVEIHILLFFCFKEEFISSVKRLQSYIPGFRIRPSIALCFISWGLLLIMDLIWFGVLTRKALNRAKTYSLHIKLGKKY